jgi:hypothetical protein
MSVIPADFAGDFPQLLQEAAGIVPENKPQPLPLQSFRFHRILLFSHYSTPVNRSSLYSVIKQYTIHTRVIFLEVTHIPRLHLNGLMK